MKNIFGLSFGALFAFLLVWTVGGVNSAENIDVKVGEVVPGFTLMGSDGKKHSLKDYSGKITVLEWFNHLCPFVRRQYDAKVMQKLQHKYAKKDVVWLSIISSAPGKQGHVSLKQANENTEKDKAFPTSVLIDRTCHQGGITISRLVLLLIYSLLLDLFVP